MAQSKKWFAKYLNHFLHLSVLCRQHVPLFFDLAGSQLTLGSQGHMQQLSNCSNSESLFIVDSCVFLIVCVSSLKC